MKGHIEQNKLKVLSSNKFWKSILANTNERSNELLKMNGQIEQNKLKVLSSN